MSDGFYTSIDKLVAFGLNNSLATSMVETMNNAMATMNMPNYAKNNRIDMTNQVAVTPATTKRFFVVAKENTVGPLDKDGLSQMIANRDVTKESLVWYQGLPGWVKAGELSELVILFNQIPPEVPIEQK